MLIQTFRRWLLELLCCLLASGAVYADDLRVPTQTETLGMLSARQFAELDARFGAVQTAYKSRKISDEDLRAAFRVFYVPDPALEKEYLAWVKNSPKSYVAHLATGIYYKKLGQDIRGDKFISETSAENLRGMEEQFAKASPQLEASLALDDKPLLSLLHMINIQQFEGDIPTARRLLDRSLVIDPKNFIIRNVFMISLQTRWGGSVEQMEAYLKECAHAGLSTEHYKALASLVIEDQGWVHQYQEGDYASAIAEYEQASKLHPTENCTPCSPLSRAANLLLETKNYEDAIQQFNKILAIAPGEITARAGRGFAELQLGQVNPALVDIHYAADRSNAYAEDLLGKMYLIGTSIPKDRDKAVEWLKQAADQGYQPAIDVLPHALDPMATFLPQPGGPRF